MTLSFTADELDILRHLIEPKKIEAVVYSVLHERYAFPEWVLTAIAHGWKPPYEWHQKERDKLGDTARRLLDHHWVELGVNWELVLHERLREMGILAVQATEPKLETRGSQGS